MHIDRKSKRKLRNVHYQQKKHKRVKDLSVLVNGQFFRVICEPELVGTGAIAAVPQCLYLKIFVASQKREICI